MTRILSKKLAIHLIDNAVARALLVRGLSTVTAGADTAGLTLEMMAQPRSIPWFDCIDSTSKHWNAWSKGRQKARKETAMTHFGLPHFDRDLPVPRPTLAVRI